MTSNELFISFFGLLGVLVGGLITFFIEHHFRKKADKRERSAALNRIHRTFASLCNDLILLHTQTQAELPEGLFSHYWPYMLPVVGESKSRIEFSYDDLAYMSGPKYDSLTHHLTELANFRNIVFDAYHTYGELRVELSRSLVPYTKIVSGDVLTNFAFRNDPALFIKENEVEALAKMIVVYLIEANERLRRLMPLYNHKLKLILPKTRARIQLPDKEIAAPFT